MQWPRGSGAVFLLAALTLFLILQELQEHDIEAAQKTTPSKQHASHIVSNSSYGDFDPESSKWLDIAGLTEDDSLLWRFLPQVKTKAISQAQTVLVSGWVEVAPGVREKVETRHLGERYTSAEQLDALSSDSPVVPFYQNVTGTIRGTWVQSKINVETALPLKPSNNSIVPSYINTNYARNITGTQGRLHLRLDEKYGASSKLDHDVVREIKAELTIENVAGESWDVPLRGTHFLSSGAILLTTSSDKFDGRNALPFLARSEDHFRLAQNLLNSTRHYSLFENKQNIQNDESQDQESDVSEAEELDLPQCEYVAYLQQHLVWPYEPSYISQTDLLDSKLPGSIVYLEMLEDELRRPSGRSIAFVPSLQFSSVIFSPDCEIVLESQSNMTPWNQAARDHLTGYKIEVLLSRIKTHVAYYIAVLFLQVILLVRQIKDASTPSTQSRISYYTIGTMIMADDGAVVTFFVLSVFTTGVYLLMISATFLLFLCVPFFGLRFLVDVWSVQASERQERERSRQGSHQAAAGLSEANSNRNNIPAVVITPAGADLLPLPATARRHANTGATPVILPPDQDIDASIAEDEARIRTIRPGNTRPSHARFNIGTKVLFSSFCLTMFSFAVSFWPLTIRTVYTNGLIFCYLSFWIPQIRRNMTRNCRKALRWEFVFGQSMLRLIPLAYFYLYEDNILFVRTDMYTFCGFAAWHWAQVLFLLSQDALGPRFFLPTGSLPPAYDYHQILREGDEENSSFMPVGTSQNGSGPHSESCEKGKWKSDCIICMHTLEVPYIERGDSSHTNSAAVSNIFARREYMITPCRHIFHSQCLEGWMRYKLQCPMCRESLPPI